MSERQGRENSQGAEVIKRFPTLGYLLGRVQSQTVTDLRDGKTKEEHIAVEGSAMFSLENKYDALQWKGIFNHIVGSVRNVNFIAGKLASTTADEKQALAARGFNLQSIETLDPKLLEGFMFVSHAGRRLADEHAWYGIHPSPKGDPQDQDKPHHSYLYTMEILEKAGASPELVELMRVEDHTREVDLMRPGINPNVVDNILTYCDWTFGQEPTSLAERFEGLRKSGRQSPEILEILETAGTNFENALKAAFGQDIYEQMASTPPFPGEIEIRTAYAASAGLSLSDIYPNFAKAQAS